MSKRVTKILSLILTLVMFLSVSTPAFAMGGDLGSGWDREIGEDEIRDFVPDEEVEEVEEYDYFSAYDETGVAVTVEAPLGALPTLAEVRANRVEAEVVRDAVNSVVDGEPNILLALDISFWLNGLEIEPEEAVRVKIAAPELEDKTNLTLVHIPDAAEPETVNLLPDEDLSFALGANEIAFEAKDFSIYVVTGGEDSVHIATYNFLDGEGNPYPFRNTAGQTVTSQKIKNGESLQYVSAPGLLGNNAFVAWYYYDKENGQYLNEVVFGQDIEVTETKDYYIKAYYGSVIYVTFYQFAKGEVVLEKKQIAQSEDGKFYCDMTSVSVPAPSTTLKFMGWSLTPGTDASETTGDAPGSRPLLSNTGLVEFTENTDVYPVYYNGVWVVFISADTGMGAKYVDSYFLPADSTSAAASEPADPTMTGYSFDGWYTEREPVEDYVKTEQESAHGTKFVFSTSFANLDQYKNDRGEIVLYGHWKPGSTTYVVVYWKQQVGNAKDAADSAKTYDYAGQTEPIMANTGSSPTPTTAQQKADTGFEYKRYQLVDVDPDTGDSTPSSGIKADGSSVLNVYFDRKLITMRFHYDTSANYSDNWTSSSYATSYTGLYGQTWAQAGYTTDWPDAGQSSSYWGTTYYGWRYFNNSNGATGMTYLGQFVLPEGVRDTTQTEIRLYRRTLSRRTIYFYLQNTDGSWPTTTSITGAGSSDSSFSFSDKYEGFRLVQYRAGANGSWQNLTITGVDQNGNRIYSPSSTSTSSDIYLRYQRETYPIVYLNPLNEEEVLSSKSALYGASLASAEPTVSSIDLGVDGYEWDGKWYKDKACTVEFNFATETMPLDGTKVYAGKTALYYFIKIDPNGGQLQASQSTWRWVTYGDDTTYTYDNIERNYSEYKGIGPKFYYYYDEFDVSRRDDIWNYRYMAPNQRTAFYTSDTSGISSMENRNHDGTYDGTPWLDSATEYGYEKDAYQLIGWYKVNADGSLTPFKTGTAITEDTHIQAQWRRTGKYTVVYEEAAVDEEFAELKDDEDNPIKTVTKISDPNAYADQSDAAIGDLVVPPSGYEFVGWLYDNKVYAPGDIFVIHARLSDADSVIHIYPVLKPVEDIPVEVIDITYYPNGGTFTDAADAQIATLIQKAIDDDDSEGTLKYNPEKVVTKDGEVVTSIGVKNLKINETFPILTAEALDRGIEVNGVVVSGRGYKLREWNTKADGSGDSFPLNVTIGVDGKDPIPNALYAIWDEVIYICHGSTGDEFETVVIKDSKAPVKDRWAYTKGFNPAGTVNKTQYTDYYYGGFAVYANGSAEATGLTFKGGDVKSGKIDASYWTRFKAAKSAELWNVEDTGAVYYLKEVPTSYLAKPVAATIRGNYGSGDITSLHFLSVTDTSIYRNGGIVYQGAKIVGTFAQQFTLKQHTDASGSTSSTILTAQSLFKLPGYLTVVNGGTPQPFKAVGCQAFWTTYDYVEVYGVEANIRDIEIK